MKIIVILLAMFVVTQFIGLAVQHADIFHIQAEVNGTLQTVSNPYLSWIQPPEIETQKQSFSILGSLIFAFIVAITLLFFLTKFKIEFILKAWFFLVVIIALFLSIYAFEKLAPFIIKPSWAFFIPFAIAIPLAYIKIYKKEFLIHNLTELFIYPGIAAVFVPILNIWTIIILLIVISIYDMWAVWHSGIMQKMAKYQINKLNIFSGFFIPYVSGKMKSKIKKMKQTMKKSELKKKKIKVNVAILGGGDVIFPIITAGVILKSVQNLPFGLKPFVGGFYPALFVIAGATLGLASLFFFSEKKKFYPAMPFITAGIFLGMVLSYFLF
jgi:presenilin-like A22 family membrane protease